METAALPLGPGRTGLAAKLLRQVLASETLPPGSEAQDERAFLLHATQAALLLLE